MPGMHLGIRPGPLSMLVLLSLALCPNPISDRFAIRRFTGLRVKVWWVYYRCHCCSCSYSSACSLFLLFRLFLFLLFRLFVVPTVSIVRCRCHCRCRCCCCCCCCCCCWCYGSHRPQIRPQQAKTSCRPMACRMSTSIIEIKAR